MFNIIYALLGTIFNFMNTSEPQSPADKAINIVISKTADEFQNKYHLSLGGIGGSGNDTTIKTSSISFSINQTLSIADTRQLIIACAREFLKNINEDSNLASYLVVQPFTEKNIKITIAMTNSDNSTTFDPQLAGVSLDKGVIRYFTNDPDKPHTFKSVIKESYEEAIKKVGSSETL